MKRLEQEREILKRATALFARETEIPVTVYRHVSAERAHCALLVSLMCERLGVSVSDHRA